MRYGVKNLLFSPQIYSTTLEEAKEFSGFEAFVKTFPLYKGKQEDDEEPQDNRIVGSFKGHFLIYRLEDEEFGREVNPKTLKLHADLPSNEPVTMLVRIYVIRVRGAFHILRLFSPIIGG